MSNNEQSLKEDLEKSILQSDPKLNRKELLVDIFKAYTAKLFEIVLMKRKEDDGRLPYDALVEVKKMLIKEFRDAELSEYQQSVEWYEDLFEETVKEILNDAALAHQGADIIQTAPQQLEIDPEAYIHEGGLYVPPHLAKR